jgi:hypothetical protein
VEKRLLVGLGGMSHKYKLSDIFARNLAGFGADRMSYRWVFMSHNMESKVDEVAGYHLGGMPIFSRAHRRDKCEKNSQHFSGNGLGKLLLLPGLRCCRWVKWNEVTW